MIDDWDLRNHGSSPHVEPHSYPAMALDISHFLAKHGLGNVNLLGHSMSVGVWDGLQLD